MRGEYDTDFIVSLPLCLSVRTMFFLCRALPTSLSCYAVLCRVMPCYAVPYRVLVLCPVGLIMLWSALAALVRKPARRNCL